MHLPNNLSNRVVQDDDLEVKVIASFEDRIEACQYFDNKLDQLRNEPGRMPKLYIETYRDGGWHRTNWDDIDDAKRRIYQILEYGRIQKKLLHRRISAGEHRVILDGLSALYLEYQRHIGTLALKQVTDIFNDLRADDIKEDFVGMTKEQVEEFILEPIKRLEHLGNLIAFLDGRNMIVETHILIPDQF